MARSANQHSAVLFALFASFAGTTLVFSPNTGIFSDMQLDGPTMGRFVFPMFIAATLVALLFAAAFRKTVPHFARNYTVLVGAAALHCAMAALFVAFAYGFAPGMAVIGAVGALYGATLVVVCLAWAHILGCLEFREAILWCMLVCVASYAVSIALSVLPQVVRGVCYMVLFAVGTFSPAVLLHNESPSVPAENKSADAYQGASTADLLSTLRLPGIGLVLFAFMMAISKLRVFGTIDAEYFGGFAAALVILPLFAIRTDAPLSALIYRIIAPAIGGVVVVLLAFPSGSSVQSVAIVLVYVFLSALAVLALANVLAIINAGEFPAEFVGSVGLAVGCAVSLAGIAWTQAFNGPSDMTPVVFVLIAIYCAFMMMSLGWESWKLVNGHAGEEAPAGVQQTVPAYDWTQRAEQAKLTKRETEILALLGRGHTITYIAETLFISESTVRTHVKHIYAKLDVHSKEELFAFVDGA